MLTSSQRSKLRGIAANEPTIMQVGKGGVSDNLVKTVSDALEARELVKLSVLATSPLSPKEMLTELATATESEGVAVIGRKIILYRESKDHKTIEL